ncbi:putative NADP(+)-dependent dehydrogenase [Aspergillus keveii]|uniref:NADP(+)-dependent dehydrogenase n=1 Tax=Aspergillus keveii TaxID=714993 RepID=A0ABR4G3H1_9EURO
MTNPSRPRLLLLLGSGPGIGVSVASRFARSHFGAVALVARNAEQLSKDRATVLAAVAEAGRAVEVRTWQADISDLSLLEKTLKEVEEFGAVECVYFNAARVAPSPLLEFPVEKIEADFRVSALSLYVTARWAMPLLAKNDSHSPDWNPAFLVTNSLLPASPFPDWFALSMTKAAQANLVKSLEKAFSSQGVHVGLVVVWGMVSTESAGLNPGNIAEQAWKLYSQKREEWTSQVTVYDDGRVEWEGTI